MLAAMKAENMSDFINIYTDMGAELAHIPISKEDENLNLLVK